MLYHIDRLNLLHQNRILDLDKFFLPNSKSLQPIVTDYYPQGLSFHGDHYYLSGSDPSQTGALVYELIYEYERKLNFPNQLSRYQSFFCTTESDLQKWLSLFSNGNLDIQKGYSIWEIDPLDSKTQEFDASLIGGGNLNGLEVFSPLVTQYFAKKYWSGEKNPEESNVLNEILVSPRMKCVRKIPLSDIQLS